MVLSGVTRKKSPVTPPGIDPWTVPLVAQGLKYRLRKLQRATRAVHNRAAACVAAGGGIFENQL